MQNQTGWRRSKKYRGTTSRFRLRGHVQVHSQLIIVGEVRYRDIEVRGQLQGHNQSGVSEEVNYRGIIR